MVPILQVENLVVTFPGSRRRTRISAVDDISLNLHPGEIVGLVGESGCGKSTLGRSIVGLERPTSGRILFHGVDLQSLTGKKLRDTRRNIQYIFQDPYASLNERQTTGQTLDEALKIGGERDPVKRKKRILDLLQQVGLPEESAQRYAREMSGGQRQRVAIARALAVDPQVLICDEPVSALDLSIRAQVMNLFLKLQKELGVACLFIAHDLTVVRQAANRVLVMYLGRLMETGESDELYRRASHPYTQALLSAIPNPDPRIERNRQRIVLQGDLPSPTEPPSGCRFRTRCPMAVEACAAQVPAQVKLADQHTSACLFANQLYQSQREQYSLSGLSAPGTMPRLSAV